MAEINIVDFGLSNRPDNEKRKYFYGLGIYTKYLHNRKNPFFIPDIGPKNFMIDIDNMMPSVKIIQNFGNNFTNEELKIKKWNTIMLATLAINCFLPESRLDQAIISASDLYNNFDNISGSIPSDDVEYYRQVLSPEYMASSQDALYYCDYIQKLSASTGKSSNLYANVKGKSTPEGRAMYPNNEAAYSSYILITSVVFSLLMLGVLAFLFIFSYLG